MSWTQRFIVVERRVLDPKRPVVLDGKVFGYDVEEFVDVATGLCPTPGDIYEEPWYLNEFPEDLSPYYFTHNAHRPPLVLVLPAAFHVRGSTMNFCVDSKASIGGKLQPDGWVVTGAPPDLTVAPSINAQGTYHGFLQNGVLTDDCEGRQFPHHPPR